jgi:ABC-type transport system involved in multi-copper enzyme maturation permease subunit
MVKDHHSKRSATWTKTLTMKHMRWNPFIEASSLPLGNSAWFSLIGIFVPLFMATGLIRNEMTSGTMHFMLAKPIARGEVFLYRMLGFLRAGLDLHHLF